MRSRINWKKLRKNIKEEFCSPLRILKGVEKAMKVTLAIFVLALAINPFLPLPIHSLLQVLLAKEAIKAIRANWK